MAFRARIEAEARLGRGDIGFLETVAAGPDSSRVTDAPVPRSDVHHGPIVKRSPCFGVTHWEHVGSFSASVL